MRQGLIPLPGSRICTGRCIRTCPDPESSVGTAGGDHDPDFKCSASSDQL